MSKYEEEEQLNNYGKINILNRNLLLDNVNLRKRIEVLNNTNIIQNKFKIKI